MWQRSKGLSKWGAKRHKMILRDNIQSITKPAYAPSYIERWSEAYQWPHLQGNSWCPQSNIQWPTLITQRVRQWQPCKLSMCWRDRLYTVWLQRLNHHWTEQSSELRHTDTELNSLISLSVYLSMCIYIFLCNMKPYSKPQIKTILYQ